MPSSPSSSSSSPRRRVSRRLAGLSPGWDAPPAVADADAPERVLRAPAGVTDDDDSAGFRSDAQAFSRRTRVAYAYADVLLSALWHALVLPRLAPAGVPLGWAYVPAAAAGAAAILVDFVWMYRAGRREVLLDGRRAPRAFVAWWLVFYFEFLIAFNMGSVLGVLLLAGIRGAPALLGAYWLWFWALAPALSALLVRARVGEAEVFTVRRLTGGVSGGRVVLALVLHAALFAAALRPRWHAALELWAIGACVALGMELPLFLFGIRRGPGRWKALLLNVLVEWNYATAIMGSVFHAAGVLFAHAPAHARLLL